MSPIHESNTEKPTEFVVNDIDYGPMIDEFIENEWDFYDMIHSYSTGSSTILRIYNENNKRISSAVLLSEYDEPVLEVKRPAVANFETQNHSSITEWYISVVGESDTFHTDMFNNVYIGDNRTPLLNILVSTLEEHEANKEKPNNNFTITIKNDEYFDNMLDYCVSVSLLVTLLIVLGICIYVIVKS